MFTDQLARIKLKLNLAKTRDGALQNFGADAHQYQLHQPLTEAAVRAFEQEHDISLPVDFRLFITTIGNGGPGHFGGAGPHYGLYALGNFGYMRGCKNTLSLPCNINAQLTRSKWEDLTAFARGVAIATGDIEFERKYDLLFAGLLPIGTQGSSFHTALILNGDARGRIASIDQDLQLPVINTCMNFVDWYERWLDSLGQKEANGN